MPKVKLGDVATECRDVCKYEKEKLPAVGLEHLTPGEIRLTSWSETANNTFSKVFRKGSVLFGRRRAYLKKAALAPFDGICSGDITVIEALPNKLLPGLLPFVIQNDAFFDYAVGRSAGSLSPRVKWEHLRNYNFTIPDIDQQRELTDILWAAENTREAYHYLLMQTDELVKSQFVELFGDPMENPKGLPLHQLEDYIQFLTSGSRGWAKYYTDGGEYFITKKNVKDCAITLEDMQHIQPPQNAEADRTRVQEGDLLISITADLGRTGVVSREIADHGAYINQHLTCIRLDKSKLNPLFAAYFMESPAGKSQFAKKNKGGVKAGLNFDDINTLRIVVPPMDDQMAFIDFVEQTEKSKLELKKAIESISSLIKSMLQQDFSN